MKPQEEKLDAMLDFETLGTGSNAVVVQVGLAIFNRYTGEIKYKYKTNVSIKKCLDMGMKIEESTVSWWLKQSDQARNSILDGRRQTPETVFHDINNHLANVDFIWSHATFDFPILCEYMKQLEIKPQFNFRRAMDIRTLHNLLEMKNIIPGTVIREGVHHDGLDDAIHQIKYVFKMLKQGEFI